MQIGVVFPQTEIGADRGAIRAYTERVEELGYAHLLAYDHVLGADPEVHTPWHGSLRRRHDVPRAVRALRLPRRDLGARAGDRDHHPAAAPDRARREAGGRGRPPHARQVPARRRPRLERGGVRSARHRLLHSGPAHQRAGRADAEPVDAARRDAPRRVRARDRGRPRAASGAATDSGVVRRGVGAGVPAGGPARRRMVPDGAAGPAARRRPPDRRGRGARGRARSGHDRHGGPRELVGRRWRRASGRPRRSLARRGRDPRRGQHDERGPRLGRRAPERARSVPRRRYSPVSCSTMPGMSGITPFAT